MPFFSISRHVLRLTAQLQVIYVITISFRIGFVNICFSLCRWPSRLAHAVLCIALLTNPVVIHPAVNKLTQPICMGTKSASINACIGICKHFLLDLTHDLFNHITRRIFRYIDNAGVCTNVFFQNRIELRLRNILKDIFPDSCAQSWIVSLFIVVDLMICDLINRYPWMIRAYNDPFRTDHAASGGDLSALALYLDFTYNIGHL